MKPFWVYMLRCADDSFYVGHTDDLERRLAEHHAGELPCYTANRRPVVLAWCAETATREEALEAELRVKGWTRAKKEALVRGEWGVIRALARGPDRVRASTTGRDPERAESSPRPYAQRERSTGSPTSTPTPTSTPPLR